MSDAFCLDVPARARYDRVEFAPQQTQFSSRRAVYLIFTDGRTHAEDVAQAGNVLPTPATHAILTVLKAGGTVYKCIEITSRV